LARTATTFGGAKLEGLVDAKDELPAKDGELSAKDSMAEGRKA
jgi:hypothetical protein